MVVVVVACRLARLRAAAVVVLGTLPKQSRSRPEIGAAASTTPLGTGELAGRQGLRALEHLGRPPRCLRRAYPSGPSVFLAAAAAQVAKRQRAPQGHRVAEIRTLQDRRDKRLRREEMEETEPLLWAAPEESPPEGPEPASALAALAVIPETLRMAATEAMAESFTTGARA